jgi:hypothetical protein
MNTMYGDMSQKLVVPDVVNSSGKQEYKAPKFRPPSVWYLAFASVDPSQGIASAIELTNVPRLAVPNTNASFTITTEYVTNKIDLLWAAATGDSSTGANFVLFYDAKEAGTVWEGVQLMSILYFSTGQRITVDAGALQIYPESPQQQN